jgi:hypothetical protein
VSRPKGIVYADLSPRSKSEANIAGAILQAVGWHADPAIDSGKRNYSSSLPVSILEANRFAAASIHEALVRAAHHYHQDYKRVPVFILDNANRLAQDQPEILNKIMRS